METQITNCDWLSFSVLMTLTAEEIATEPRMQEPPGFAIVEASGTNMYKRRALVYDQHGDKVLTLLWQPHSRIIDGNSLFVEVANPLLYSGHYRGILYLLSTIHPYTWQSLSRVDICTDFQPSIMQSQVIDMLQAGSVYVQGKQEGTMWHSYAAAGKYVKRTPHQLAWGSKTSQIKWKLYNKTKEIFEHTPDGRTWCNKPYIAEVWAKSGFDTSRDTWRLEVSITSSGQLEWRGHRLNWDTISDPDTLASLYYDLYQTRMKMRLNQGHDNKRYDKEVDFLEVPSDEVCRVQKAAAASEQIHIAFAPTIRALVKELERPEATVTPSISAPLLATLEHIVVSAGLRGYFAAMVGRDIFTYCDEYRQNNSGRPRPPAGTQNEKDTK